VESVTILANTGVWLMFVLGLRHGFDPDHIAIIDALTVRTQDSQPGLAPWIGALFAAGHGGVVSLIAVAVCVLSARVTVPEGLVRVVEWFPVVLLLAVGTANAVSLAVSRGDTPAVWHRVLRPGRGRRIHPVSVVLTGAVFALVFDTTTQAAAWGYAAAERSGVGAAVAIGGAFTLGMLLTDTLDSQLLSGLLRRASAQDARTFRIYLGLVVVFLSFGAAGLGIASRLDEDAGLPDRAVLALGVGCVALVLCGYAWIALRIRNGAGRRATAPAERGGGRATHVPGK
jgi:high-affinity nickel-transport protein